MNARLSMAEIAAKLTSDLSTATVSTSYSRDYLQKFAQSYPYVWVCAQRANPLDDGRGVTGQTRQKVKIEFLIRVIVKRYEDGVLDNSAELDSLCNAVSSSLFGWNPTGALFPLVLERMQDGQPEESVMNVDIILSTEALYVKNV